MSDERINRLSRTLENVLHYIRGTGQWFSARNKTAVMSQLVEAQKELDKLQAVVKAACMFAPALDMALYEFQVRLDSAKAGREFGNPGVEFWQQAVDGIKQLQDALAAYERGEGVDTI